MTKWIILLIIMIGGIGMVSAATTINISDPDSANLDDSWFDGDSPTAKKGGISPGDLCRDDDGTDHSEAIFKFDLSLIPDGQTIDSSSFCFYISSNLYDTSTEGIYTTVHRVYQYPSFNISGSIWLEEDINYDTRPNITTEYNHSYTERLKFTGDNSSSQFYCADVTDSVREEYSLSNQNITLFLKINETIGTPTSLDKLQFYLKEASGVNSVNRPTLNVTYSAISGNDTSFTVTLPSGKSQGIFNTSLATNSDVSPDGQTGATPFFQVTNTGNTNIDIGLLINLSLPSQIYLKADTDNVSSGATEVNNSKTNWIYQSLAASASVDIWLWSDFTNALQQALTGAMNISSQTS